MIDAVMVFAGISVGLSYPPKFFFDVIFRQSATSYNVASHSPGERHVVDSS